MKEYKTERVELANTNYPILEERLEQVNHVYGELTYNDNSPYMKFKADDGLVVEVEYLTQNRIGANEAYFEDEDYFWTFLFLKQNSGK